MATSRGSRAAVVATLFSLIAAGCSNSEFDLVPVAGKVTIAGQPFTEGKVMFSPIAKGKDGVAGRFAIGRVDANGQFSLGTYKPGDGAVVGQHWVTLIRIKPEEDPGSITVTPVSTGGRTPFDRLEAPRQVTIAAGGENRIDIDLTAEEVAKYGTIDD